MLPKRSVESEHAEVVNDPSPADPRETVLEWEVALSVVVPGEGVGIIVGLGVDKVL